MSKNAKSGNCSRGGEKRLFLSKDDVKPNNLRIYEKKWHEKQNPTNMLLLQGGRLRGGQQACVGFSPGQWCFCCLEVWSPSCLQKKCLWTSHCQHMKCWHEEKARPRWWRSWALHGLGSGFSSEPHPVSWVTLYFQRAAEVRSCLIRNVEIQHLM